MDLQQAEQLITEFLQEHYTDEKLAALLAHAEDGKLAYMSCCCLVGFPFADHAPQGENELVPSCHPTRVNGNPLPLADFAYWCLGSEGEDDEANGAWDFYENVRRQRLIPIIKREMERRDRMRATVNVPERDAETYAVR